MGRSPMKLHSITTVVALVFLSSVGLANADQPKTAIPIDDVTEGKTETPPATAFDLRHWKLTLPTGVARGGDSDATEVSTAQLVGGFKDPHFYFDADGAMVFWCPVNGVTTEGTEYPRSELREMLEPNDPAVNWTAKGTHVLTARCRVLEVPSDPKVVIGQIHSYSGKAKPLVKLQFYKGRIEALVKSSPTKGKDIKLVWPKVGLDRDINYTIKLENGVLSITVNGKTQTQNIAKNDPEWMKQNFYFKAGAYVQDNQGPATEGARISFSRLTVNHE